jgi:pyridoxal phosphate enzyme (YggS family)
VDTEYHQRRQVIRDNYASVVERIYKAATDAGRNPEEIRLVVVTKTHPVAIIQSVIDAGATDLGENYVEEALPKIQALSKYSDIRWHMIGHVQRRKVKEVCEYFQYVHSIDSLKLAERLSRFVVSRSEPFPVWMEFNAGGEETKSGWNIASKARWPDILPEIKQVSVLPGLKFMGVMTVPPYSPEPETSRSYYRRLKEFQTFIIDQLGLADFKELSIGMSSDFEVAIQEGSTCVRVGQAILGPRSE